MYRCCKRHMAILYISVPSYDVIVPFGSLPAGNYKTNIGEELTYSLVICHLRKNVSFDLTG